MDKKKQIITASQELFAKFGLKKVTTDDIARDASVSKATIYKYYKNKSQIFSEVVMIEFDELFQKINEAVDLEKTVTGKFRAHLLSKMGNLHQVLNFYRVTRQDYSEYWPHIEDIRHKYLEEEEKIVRDILILGNKRKELKVKDVDTTAHILVVALKSIESPWTIENLGISLEKYVEMMLSILLDGIRKR